MREYSMYDNIAEFITLKSTNPGSLDDAIESRIYTGWVILRLFEVEDSFCAQMAKYKKPKQEKEEQWK